MLFNICYITYLFCLCSIQGHTLNAIQQPKIMLYSTSRDARCHDPGGSTGSDSAAAASVPVTTLRVTAMQTATTSTSSSYCQLLRV